MIIDENEHFWVLNKPEGESINDEASSLGLITQFKEALKQQAHPVHRLDKHTSGLLLVAKSTEANAALSLLFQNKNITKYYLAVTRTRPGAKPKKKQGCVSGDMVKSRNGSWKLLNSRDNPAETHFKSSALGERRRLCLIKPLSGKTHQIRVAMRALSMPIVGDLRYGGEESDRLYLHAFRLSFELFGRSYSYEHMPENGKLFEQVSRSTIESIEL